MLHTEASHLCTLSLHDALPILPQKARRRSPGYWSSVWCARRCASARALPAIGSFSKLARPASRDRKSTRLNSSDLVISYAVVCLNKKNRQRTEKRLELKTRNLC